jgi:hypothetical protein
VAGNWWCFRQLGTAGQTSALTGALGSLAQGGDPKDAILAAVTGGISGGLTDAVGKALGVSKDSSNRYYSSRSSSCSGRWKQRSVTVWLLSWCK